VLAVLATMPATSEGQKRRTLEGADAATTVLATANTCEGAWL
jgi:hypothetical protein